MKDQVLSSWHKVKAMSDIIADELLDVQRDRESVRGASMEYTRIANLLEELACKLDETRVERKA